MQNCSKPCQLSGASGPKAKERVGGAIQKAQTDPQCVAMNVVPLTIWQAAAQGEEEEARSQRLQEPQHVLRTTMIQQVMRAHWQG